MHPAAAGIHHKWKREEKHQLSQRRGAFFYFLLQGQKQTKILHQKKEKIAFSPAILITPARCLKVLRHETLCESSASCFTALSTACDGGHRLKVSGFVVWQRIKQEKLKLSRQFSFH